MTIKGRLLSSTAIVKRFQNEKKIQVHLSDRIPFPLEFRNHIELWGYQAEKKFDDIFIRFDTIPACDKQTRSVAYLRFHKGGLQPTLPPSLPSPPLPLEVGPLNPARGSGGAL